MLCERPKNSLHVGALRIVASSKVRPRDKKKLISRIDIFVNGRPHKILIAKNGVIPPSTVSLGKSKEKLDWLVQAIDHNNSLVAASRSR
jgi:hypothetical protein